MFGLSSYDNSLKQERSIIEANLCLAVLLTSMYGAQPMSDAVMASITRFRGPMTPWATRVTVCSYVVQGLRSHDESHLTEQRTNNPVGTEIGELRSQAVNDCSTSSICSGPQ